MKDSFSRTQLLIGENNLNKIMSAKVLLFGLGGVGSYTLEALVRAGVGQIGVVDCDVYSSSNINRQLYATLSSIGRKKIDVAMERVQSINPKCIVECYDMFVLPECILDIPFENYDYVIDAIDTVTAKLAIITRCSELNIPIISCMGTGNKIYTDFEIADIKKTSVCPLARVMRSELKKRDIHNVKVLFSKQEPLIQTETIEENGRHLPASISFVPAVAGLSIAGEVIRDLIDLKKSI